MSRPPSKKTSPGLESHHNHSRLAGLAAWCVTCNVGKKYHLSDKGQHSARRFGRSSASFVFLGQFPYVAARIPHKLNRLSPFPKVPLVPQPPPLLPLPIPPLLVAVLYQRSRLLGSRPFVYLDSHDGISPKELQRVMCAIPIGAAGDVNSGFGRSRIVSDWESKPFKPKTSQFTERCVS